MMKWKLELKLVLDLVVWIVADVGVYCGNNWKLLVLFLWIWISSPIIEKQVNKPARVLDERTNTCCKRSGPEQYHTSRIINKSGV